MNLFKIVTVALPLTLVAQAAWADMQAAPAAAVDRNVQSEHARQPALRLSKEEQEILAASYMSYFWNRQTSSDERH